MGIKFLCTQCGKKLNVKAFLAGKRAICPHCSQKIEIPPEAAEHTINMGVSPMAALKAAGAGGPAMAVPVSGGVATQPLPQGGYGAAGVSGPAMRGAPAAMPMPASMPAQAATGYPAPSSQPAMHQQPMPAPQPMSQPAYAAPTTAIPMGSPMATPVGMPMPAPTPPQAAGPPDPITEAPTAVWYVRPPTGGQFGPAPGDTMRKWITEGRVTADSLVWREGWADWKNAGGIFPSLGATLPPPAIGANLPSTASSKTTTPLTARGGGGSSMAITLVIVLVILIVPLLGILIYVLTRPPSTPTPAKPKDTARRVTMVVQRELRT